jgi:coronin-1B/1C/6
MAKVVRSSKFRHVFGQPFKKEECYDELRVTRSAWDTNLISANPSFFAVILEAAGGGAFAVLPWSQTGKFDPKNPIVTGHKSAVLDLDWNPFNDNLIASGSEDCTAKIWSIPDGGLKETQTEAAQTLIGHKRKVGTVNFNPIANNVLATSSTDFSVKIWDIEKGTANVSVDGQHPDIINCVDWSPNGALLATSCKDKKIRIVDPRQSSVTQEVEAHQGIKGSRVCFLGNKPLLFSVGFTKTSEREMSLWDVRNLSERLHNTNLDSSSGVLMPFFDADTNVLFLAGKGDGNIRYYELTDDKPYLHYLSEYKSNTPARGMTMLPKRGVNVSDCEIVRLCKLGVKTMEPISFCVPRKSDLFQDDLFPPAFSGEYTLTAEEWLAGGEGEQKKVSLEGGFTKKDKPATEFKPVQQEAKKELSDKELREEYEKLQKRVAYLEAELVKRDAKIKELSG